MFAVAAQISLDNNFGGCIYGAAKSRTVLNHYMETFGAMYVSRLSENGIGGFVIAENQAAKLLEVYNFERY